MSAPAAQNGNLQPDADAEDAFLELREQLNALDYNFPLDIESASLARRLLDDLILTTENYELLRQAKEQLEREAKHGHVANKLRPLQTENARLVRENNEVRTLHRLLATYAQPDIVQLHKELIRRGDAMDANNKQRIIETKRLSEQVAALEFSEKQHLDLIAEQVG